MSDTSHQPLESGNDIPATRRGDRARWQLGLWTLFLLITAIAVWMTYFINRRQIAVLEARIRALVPLAHELVVDDPAKIAIVKLEEYWFDENRWDIYLPQGRYRLCLATHDIDNNGLAPVVKSAAIEAGRHRLALEQQRQKDGWRVVVAWDGTGLLAVEESKDWDPGLGSSGGGQYPVSEQLAADEPAVLFRRRFTREASNGLMTTPSGPTEGILLWIEKMDGPNAAR
jgi:hypothetical protein